MVLKSQARWIVEALTNEALSKVSLIIIDELDPIFKSNIQTVLTQPSITLNHVPFFTFIHITGTDDTGRDYDDSHMFLQNGLEISGSASQVIFASNTRKITVNL